MGIQCAGTMKSEDMEVTDDLLVHGDAEVVGTLYVGTLSSGANVSTNHIVSPLTVDAGSHLTAASGATNIDYALSTGTFKSPSGANTLSGDTTVAAGKTLAVTTADKLLVGGKIVPQHVILNVPLDASSVNQWVFVADAAYELDTVELAYTVKSTGASTFDLKKSTSVQAPASGATMLTGTISLAQTANTVYAGTKHGTEATRRLADGDKMSVCFTGDVTGLVGGVATIRLFRV